MVLLPGGSRTRGRRYVALALLTALVLWVISPAPSISQAAFDKALDTHELRRRFPLTWEHVHAFNGTGGSWYIPAEWLKEEDAAPKDILEAAALASRLALADNDRQIPFSSIPLIVHQTAASSRIDKWKPEILPWVESWLQYTTPSPASKHPVAYFFWDDEGIFRLARKQKSVVMDDFSSILTPVERADVFRVLVCNEFGGVYADVDTEPLRHPATWTSSHDIAAWKDEQTDKSYGVAATADGSTSRPVRLLWGLEADTDPKTDTYWRMGYTYPVQITQWALASSPQHPVLSRFLDNLRNDMSEAKASPTPDINKADPLTRTGPAAVTKATMSWLEEKTGFRWNALTGRHDGGKSKLVSDVLVLPITAFSPGRGRYGNMGSKPITDVDARLVHHGMGSWKHTTLLIEYGKFCRTFFGLCRDWTKVPS